MFNPSQEDVRRFFCDVYAKHRQGLPMEALETIAAGWIDEHPEYHEDLADADAAVARVYDGANGRENPVPSFVDALVDQRAVLHRPAARHPPGRRSCWPRAAARCCTPTTRRWNAWAR
jgi:hypothetical protein